ncbi:MAG: cation transport regulator ChaB [Calothrix sp. SM1_7_51]|nr:cation transport regulator ChaB [Calothrix sp. SM1_7_51]
MLYTSNQELPSQIRSDFPEEYQDLYRAAFNSAVHWYGNNDKAHQVAWSAVKTHLAQHLLGVIDTKDLSPSVLVTNNFDQN